MTGDDFDLRESRAGRDVIGKKVVNHFHRRPRRALNTLPAPPPGFSGRDKEFRTLMEALDPRVPEQNVVHGITGMPGVGKTALALALSNTAMERRWFAGALFIDLAGMNSQPLSPAQALASLLRQLGVAEGGIPSEIAERKSLYRQKLGEATAKSDGSILIVADNASTTAQVEAITPGNTHRLLFTSHLALFTLAEDSFHLRPLAPEDSLVLLHKALGSHAPERLVEEPEAARSIIASCDGLPLALRICASHLRADREGYLHVFSSQLASSRRLELLDSGQQTISHRFGLVVRYLSPESSRLWTLLSQTPGAMISTGAAAALLGSSFDHTRALLLRLTHLHLVEQRFHDPDGWRVHTLLKTYAQGHTPRWTQDAEHRASVHRMLDYYLAVTDSRQGSWVGDEGVETLAGAVFQADALGHSQAAINIALRIADFLWVTEEDRKLCHSILTVALKYATSSKSLRHLAQVWNHLGTNRQDSDRFDDAESAFQNSLALARVVDEPILKASCQLRLSQLLHKTGRCR
ncbi:NB-ARC domain-containing protein [Nocardiopsis sp. JB363]|uniref:NB-ARC domain-containing protein n=1 Tax=Nocardiopsis sp. JB363 TaxID=1434837 RepID=UPI00097B978C|nr:NB-ARC domain-containing protein [Nocardiopsis sp. JB363]SIO90106.1 transcriptional regulator, SARP family [Nocardiopsis sp. JB363]